MFTKRNAGAETQNNKPGTEQFILPVVRRKRKNENKRTLQIVARLCMVHCSSLRERLEALCDISTVSLRDRQPSYFPQSTAIKHIQLPFS